MSAGITLLTFDLDNTLWDVNKIIRRAETAMRAWLDDHYPHWQALGVQRLIELRQYVYQQQPDIRHDLTALRKAVLLQLLLESGYTTAEAQTGSESAFEAFYQERNQVELFNGVLSTLATLRQRYALYALSNGNADIQRAGLGHLFSQQFSAASVGQAKPHPAMFEAALTHAGINADAAVHIGDHPEQDVAAAQAVGMRSIWVNYDNQAWPLTRPADAEIQHFDQLLDMLAQWR